MNFPNVFQCLLIGFSIAAIPGPVFIETARRTLTKHWHSALLLVIGVFVGNIILFDFIFIGFSRFLTIPIVSVAMYILGALLMVWLGVNALKIQELSVTEEEELSDRNSLAIGFLFSISDPFVIALWAALSAAYLQHFSRTTALSYIVVISVGFLVFFIPLIIIIKVLGKKIPHSGMVWLSRIGGVLLLLAAMLFFYKVFLII